MMMRSWSPNLDSDYAFPYIDRCIPRTYFMLANALKTPAQVTQVDSFLKQPVLSSYSGSCGAKGYSYLVHPTFVSTFR